MDSTETILLQTVVQREALRYLTTHDASAFEHLNNTCKGATRHLNIPGINRWTFVAEFLHHLLDPYLGKSETDILAFVSSNKVRYIGRGCCCAMIDLIRHLTSRKVMGSTQPRYTESVEQMQGQTRDSYSEESSPETGLAPLPDSLVTPVEQSLDQGQQLRELAAHFKQLKRELGPRLFETMEAIAKSRGKGDSTRAIASSLKVSPQSARANKRELQARLIELQRRELLQRKWTVCDLFKADLRYKMRIRRRRWTRHRFPGAGLGSAAYSIRPVR